MKVHKVTLMVVDHDDVGNEIIDVLENTKYPNRCISPTVISIESRDIGAWFDNHPLNCTDFRQTFEYLFSSDYNRAIEEAAERVRGCSYMDAYSQNELAKDIEDLKRWQTQITE